MKTIKEFTIKHYGIENSQYWQGDSALYTEFDELSIGTGDTEREAFQDAVESLCMCFPVNQDTEKFKELLNAENNYKDDASDSVCGKITADLKHDMILDVKNGTTNILSKDELEEIKDMLFDEDESFDSDIKAYLENSSKFDEYVENHLPDTDIESYWYVGIFVKFEEREED